MNPFPELGRRGAFAIGDDCLLMLLSARACLSGSLGDSTFKTMNHVNWADRVGTSDEWNTAFDRFWEKPRLDNGEKRVRHDSSLHINTTMQKIKTAEAAERAKHL